MNTVNLESDDVAAAGPCKRLGDSFSPESRRLIGRLCRAFLDQNTLTASELFSRTDMQQKMSNNAQELQRAVQVLAGAQARSFTTDLHKRMRILFKLQDTVMQTVSELAPGVEATPLAPGGLSAAIARFKTKPGGPKAQMAGVVSVGLHLKDKETWDDKFDTLITFMEQETDEQALALIDSYLGDVIDSPAALKALFGQALTMGERITELIYLHKGKWPPAGLEEPSVLLGRLNVLLQKHLMPHTRLSLELQVVRALQGGLPVTKGAGIKEFLLLIEFFEELDVNNVGASALIGADPTDKNEPSLYEQIIGGHRVVQALETRIARQVELENLVYLLEDHQTVVDKVMVLLELQIRTVGAANKKAISDFLRIQFERRDFPVLLLEVGSSPTQKLKVIADLWGRVVNSEIPDTLKERIANQLEDIQMKFIKDNKIFARIAQQSSNSVETVMKLIDLCAKGLFTGGKNQLYVHSLVKHQLGTSAFMQAYLQGVDGATKDKKLSLLKQRLAAAGIESETVA